MYKCKICGKKYTELTALYNHIENKHKDMIPKDMTVQQYYYYMKTGKMNGNCVMCKQPTSWNPNTGKYNRFCGNIKCKDEYVKIMKNRMIAKYGKTHLLNDPNKQREMLANRKISGTYEWSNGRHETTYTGSYELDFLKTLDEFFNWDPEDISMPSPHTYTYKYEGEDKFYIPDVFIHSLDLEIEIKDGGDNPNNHHKIQEVDKEKERLKDDVMKSQKHFHYIKITNKNYENFFQFLKEIKKEFEKYGDDKKIPRLFKIEDIKGVNVKPVKESFDDCLIEATTENERQTEILARQLMTKLKIHRNNKSNVDYSWNRIGNGKAEFIIKAGNDSKNMVVVFKKEVDINKHKNIMKMVKLTESYDIIEENITTNLIGKFLKLDEKNYWDNDYFLSLKFDLAKNSPEELKRYILTLITAAKGYDDFEYIKMVADKSAKTYHNLKIDMNDKDDPYKQFYDWIERGGGMDAEIKDRKDYLKKKTKRKMKEKMNKPCVESSDEIIEEKFNPDKALVWLDKPIQKLKGGKIKLYHGSSVEIKDNMIDPISINVGATKFSEPRWSTYFWDNREYAMSWAIMWNIHDLIGPNHIAYGYNNDKGKNLICPPEDISEKEYKKYIINNIKPFYIYEVEVDIKDLEIGSCPTIREYTVSKPVEITRVFTYKDIKGDIFKRFIEFVPRDVFDDYSNRMSNIKTVPNNRGILLNHLLQKGRDLYRGIIRTDLRNGNIKPGDDLSEYRDVINKHYKQDTYGLFKESYIIDTMEESSISIPQMSMYLQNEYEEEMKRYLNTYKKYYNLMLAEQPAAVKHINEDIRKCLIVIDGLAKKGVENNLVQFAKDDLGSIVKAAKHGKPVKVYEASEFKLPTKGDLWVSTDWHFYKNKNNTGFKTNPNIDKIIKNYNRCVKSNDTFIFLGDLYDARTIFDVKQIPRVFDIKKLKGYKIMIKGNHDANTDQFYLDLGFDEVHERYQLGNIIFSHEPIVVVDDEINVHGHIHYSDNYWGIKPTNHIDTFIEHYDYKPVKINDLINEHRNSGRLTQRAIVSYDSCCIRESMVEDMVNIDDAANDINSITVQDDNVSISNQVIECKLVYNNPDSKHLFSLMDMDSKLIIENTYVVQRDKVGTQCSVTPYYKDIVESNVVKFQISINESMYNLEEKINNGIVITNLFKFDDNEYKFIKEMCLKLFGSYPKEIKFK